MCPQIFWKVFFYGHSNWFKDDKLSFFTWEKGSGSKTKCIDRFSEEKYVGICCFDVWENFFGEAVRHSLKLFKVKNAIKIYQTKTNCSAQKKKILFKKFLRTRLHIYYGLLHASRLYYEGGNANHSLNIRVGFKINLNIKQKGHVFKTLHCKQNLSSHTQFSGCHRRVVRWTYRKSLRT